MLYYSAHFFRMIQEYVSWKNQFIFASFYGSELVDIYFLRKDFFRHGSTSSGHLVRRYIYSVKKKTPKILQSWNTTFILGDIPWNVTISFISREYSLKLEFQWGNFLIEGWLLRSCWRKWLPGPSQGNSTWGTTWSRKKCYLKILNSMNETTKNSPVLAI